MLHLLLAVASVLVLATADFSLTILHTNDVHARIEEADKYGGPCTKQLADKKECYGGLSRIRTKVNELRAKYPNQIILLDAGDQFQGTLWFYVYGGVVSAQFMNLIGYRAMAIGNHEFDNGVEGLAPFARSLTFPLLSSNINLDQTPQLSGVVKKSAKIFVGGQEIGVVGYTTPDTSFISSPGTATFTQELGAVQAEIDKLVASGVNKIIALGHSGFDMDLDLARRLKNVDVVVGGHTNTFLYTGTSPSNEKPTGPYPTVVESLDNGRKVLVVQDYAYGKYLGELHVTFNDAGELISWSGNPILLDKSVMQDAITMALVKAYQPKVEEMKKTVIGQTYVDLLAKRVQCRTTECSLGNLVADALVHFNLRQTGPDSWTEAGIALVNAGSFRASIPKGNITSEQVIFVQPFRNTVDIMEILGQTLMELLEFGASKWTEDRDNAFGGFLQVSGLQIAYDIHRPVGRRVVEVLAVCTKCLVPKLEPLQLQQIYRVLTSSYIMNGGDGYSMLPSKIIKIIARGYLDTDIMMNYVKKVSPITIGLQGRIRHVHSKGSSKACSGTSSHNTSFNKLSSVIPLLLIWIKYLLNNKS